jgi:hypothetical protein
MTDAEHALAAVADHARRNHDTARYKHDQAEAHGTAAEALYWAGLRDAYADIGIIVEALNAQPHGPT